MTCYVSSSALNLSPRLACKGCIQRVRRLACSKRYLLHVSVSFGAREEMEMVVSITMLCRTDHMVRIYTFMHAFLNTRYAHVPYAMPHGPCNLEIFTASRAIIVR